MTTTLGGPGVADMKSGIAILLAALQAVESVGVPNLGYEVVINSDAAVDYYLMAASRDLVTAFPWATGAAGELNVVDNDDVDVVAGY